MHATLRTWETSGDKAREKVSKKVTMYYTTCIAVVQCFKGGFRDQIKNYFLPHNYTFKGVDFRKNKKNSKMIRTLEKCIQKIKRNPRLQYSSLMGGAPLRDVTGGTRTIL